MTEKTFNFRQSKAINSAIPRDTPIKIHVHNLIMVIYIQYKFYEMPSIGYLVTAEDRKKIIEVQTIKGQ